MKVREADFQKLVIDYARLKGWRVAHFRPAQRRDGAWMTPVAADGAGFPDLCMVRRGRLVFAELKRKGVRKVRDEQAAWLDALDGAGIETYVWNPLDWDRVQELLA